MPILPYLVFPLLGYLSGSLPFAIWITRRVKNVDVRDAGSGHATTTNTIRQAGFGWGALVLILDITKGFIPTYLAIHYTGNNWIIALTAALALAGHCWPLFAQFRGGMGLATFGGALLAANWFAFLIGLGLLLALTLVLRHGAAPAFLPGSCSVLLFWLLNLRGFELWIAVACGLVIAFASSSTGIANTASSGSTGRNNENRICHRLHQRPARRHRQQHELEVIPCILVLDGKEYADGIDISREDFYKRFHHAHLHSHRQRPRHSIGEFSSRYELLTRVVATISSPSMPPGTRPPSINVCPPGSTGFRRKDHQSSIAHPSHSDLGFQVLAAAEAAETGYRRPPSMRSNLRASACISTPPSRHHGESQAQRARPGGGRRPGKSAEHQAVDRD